MTFLSGAEVEQRFVFVWRLKLGEVTPHKSEQGSEAMANRTIRRMENRFVKRFWSSQIRPLRWMAKRAVSRRSRELLREAQPILARHALQADGGRREEASEKRYGD